MAMRHQRDPSPPLGWTTWCCGRRSRAVRRRVMIVGRSRRSCRRKRDLLTPGGSRAHANVRSAAGSPYETHSPMPVPSPTRERVASPTFPRRVSPFARLPARSRNEAIGPLRCTRRTSGRPLAFSSTCVALFPYMRVVHRICREAISRARIHHRTSPSTPKALSLSVRLRFARPLSEGTVTGWTKGRQIQI